MSIKMIGPAGSGGIVQGRSGTSYTVASDGTISNVASLDVGSLLDAGWGLYGLYSEKASFNSPLPADLISIKAAAAPANGAIIIAAQPPHARKLQVRVVDGGTHITAGALVLVGVDQDGNAITETISLIGTADRTTVSKWAYAKLTSGTVSALAGGGSSTLGIGLSNDFGVPTMSGPSTPVNLACSKATKVTKVLGTSNVAADDVAATATVDATARTIAPTTAPAASGLVDYEFSYTFGAAA